MARQKRIGYLGGVEATHSRSENDLQQYLWEELVQLRCRSMAEIATQRDAKYGEGGVLHAIFGGLC